MQLAFSRLPTLLPPFSFLLFIYFFIVICIIYTVGSPLFFQFSVMGAGAGAGFILVGGAHGWIARRAGS